MDSRCCCALGEERRIETGRLRGVAAGLGDLRIRCRGARKLGSAAAGEHLDHERGRLQAQAQGFDLHAARTIPAQRPNEHARLEELLRYCARPPISDERLRIGAEGSILLRLKTPWKDGSTHVVYEPLDLIAKLAALVPRPHKNLVVYHGVLVANGAWRSRVVVYGRQEVLALDARWRIRPLRTRLGICGVSGLS
jgi:hypothetical protein